MSLSYDWNTYVNSISKYYLTMKDNLEKENQWLRIHFEQIVEILFLLTISTNVSTVDWTCIPPLDQSLKKTKTILVIEWLFKDILLHTRHQIHLKNIECPEFIKYLENIIKIF